MTFNLLKELGYLTEDQAKKIVKLTNGKTYLNYGVGYGVYNNKANCIINVTINTDDKLEQEEIKELKDNYLAYLVSTALDYVKE